jgi:hypothetical protein
MITIRFTTDYALYARMRLLACRWAGGEELTSDEVLILFCYAAVRLRPAPIPCSRPDCAEFIELHPEVGR